MMLRRTRRELPKRRLGETQNRHEVSEDPWAADKGSHHTIENKTAVREKEHVPSVLERARGLFSAPTLALSTATVTGQSSTNFAKPMSIRAHQVLKAQIANAMASANRNERNCDRADTAKPSSGGEDVLGTSASSEDSSSAGSSGFSNASSSSYSTAPSSPPSPLPRQTSWRRAGGQWVTKYQALSDESSGWFTPTEGSEVSDQGRGSIFDDDENAMPSKRSSIRRPCDTRSSTAARGLKAVRFAEAPTIRTFSSGSYRSPRRQVGGHLASSAYRAPTSSMSGPSRSSPSRSSPTRSGRKVATSIFARKRSVAQPRYGTSEANVQRGSSPCFYHGSDQPYEVAAAYRYLPPEGLIDAPVDGSPADRLEDGAVLPVQIDLTSVALEAERRRQDVPNPITEKGDIFENADETLQSCSATPIPSAPGSPSSRCSPQHLLHRLAALQPDSRDNLRTRVTGFEKPQNTRRTFVEMKSWVRTPAERHDFLTWASRSALYVRGARPEAHCGDFVRCDVHREGVPTPPALLTADENDVLSEDFWRHQVHICLDCGGPTSVMMSRPAWLEAWHLCKMHERYRPSH